jgi:hypothetical protein
MTKKLVRIAGDSSTITAILTLLVEIGKAQLQTGHDVNGRPVTQEDFAIVNRARATLRRLKDEQP